MKMTDYGCLCGHAKHLHDVSENKLHSPCRVTDGGIQCTCRSLNTAPTLEDQEQEALERIHKAMRAIKPDISVNSFDDYELYQRLNSLWWVLTMAAEELISHVNRKEEE